MHRTSLAPVLSATRHRDSCWITGGYLALSTISTTRHRLVLDSGRVSEMRTVSPTCASLASSCALSLVVRRMILWYRGWLTWLEIRTTTVLFMASATTTPVHL